MDMPTIYNYMENGRSNAILVSVGGVDVYFSYRTPVAFRVNGRLVVRENEWGPTTGKHLNSIDGLDKGSRVNGDEFQRLFAELVGEVSP